MEVSPPSTSPHAPLHEMRVAGHEHRRRRHHHPHHQRQQDQEEDDDDAEELPALLHPHHQGASANGERKEDVVEDDEKQAYQRHMLFSRHYSFHVNSHPNRVEHLNHHPQPQLQLQLHLQQQQPHQQPTFSRHASFNLPPRSKPLGSTAPSFASLSSSSSMFSRAPSFHDPKSRRALDRIVSMDRHQAPEVNFSSQEDVWKGEFVSTPSKAYGEKEEDEEKEKKRTLTRNSAAASTWTLAISALSSGKRSGPRKLLMLIILNFAYSFVELLLGLISGHIGLVSDAFHLTFGCGLLSFSFIAMLFTKKISDETYTYGYKRLEVLAAFTNAIFLLFLSFSLSVEALHAFIQDESEHKHYLIVSAVTNLFVNLVGVWFFRGYARIRIAYRKAEDMNYHSIFLHVLADSIRSAGLILASWLLTLGVNNAETLCLGLVAIAIFLLVMPLFKATAGVLLQMSPQTISASMLHKCHRQVVLLESILECQARFWEMVPGFVVGTIILQVKEGTDDQKVLKHVHSVYNDIGIKDLTVQLELHV